MGTIRKASTASIAGRTIPLAKYRAVAGTLTPLPTSAHSAWPAGFCQAELSRVMNLMKFNRRSDLSRSGGHVIWIARLHASAGELDYAELAIIISIHNSGHLH